MWDTIDYKNITLMSSIVYVNVKWEWLLSPNLLIVFWPNQEVNFLGGRSIAKACKFYICFLLFFIFLYGGRNWGNHNALQVDEILKRTTQIKDIIFEWKKAELPKKESFVLYVSLLSHIDGSFFLFGTSLGESVAKNG